jgi:hypothetical protein
MVGSFAGFIMCYENRSMAFSMYCRDIYAIKNIELLSVIIMWQNDDLIRMSDEMLGSENRDIKFVDNERFVIYLSKLNELYNEERAFVVESSVVDDDVIYGDDDNKDYKNYDPLNLWA